MQYRNLVEMIADIEAEPLERGGHVYHPIPYPEFAHLKTSSDGKQAVRKWKFIHGALLELFPEGMAQKKVLDIGANVGYYSFCLAQEGAAVTAFESNERYAAIGTTITREKQLSVTWHPVAFDPALVAGETYDLALLLSVFQWMCDGGRRMEEAVRRLRDVSGRSRAMVFELGYNHGKSCLSTRKLNHYGELIRFLDSNTEYRCFRQLGATRLWRKGKRYLVLCSHDPEFDDGILRRTLRRVLM